jgi:hypothetical protein
MHEELKLFCIIYKYALADILTYLLLYFILFHFFKMHFILSSLILMYHFSETISIQKQLTDVPVKHAFDRFLYSLDIGPS